MFLQKITIYGKWINQFSDLVDAGIFNKCYLALFTASWFSRGGCPIKFFTSFYLNNALNKEQTIMKYQQRISGQRTQSVSFI